MTRLRALYAQAYPSVLLCLYVACAWATGLVVALLIYLGSDL